MQTKVADGARTIALGEDRTDPLLERVALALNSTLELREVLRLLAEITLEATGAARCGLFLLEGRVIEPVVAIGTVPDEDLWAEFRAMGSVPVDRIPMAWDSLLRGRPVPVGDAASSLLIPESWTERFDLRSVALVPLLAMGEPCGLMGVDYQEDHEFTESETRLLEAIGMYAGVAIRNARLFDSTRKRARLQEALAAGAAALVSPLDPSGIARELANAYSELLNARLCAIGLVDEERTTVTALAAHGTDSLGRSLAVADIPERIVSQLSDTASLTRFIDLGNDPWLAENLGGSSQRISSYVVLPLFIGEDVRGGVLLGFRDAKSLDGEERAAAEALASMAAAALERSMLLEKLEQQLRRLEVLHALGSALAEQAHAERLVGRLNELLAHDGIEVAGLAFRDRDLARRLGGDEPTSQERALWRKGGSEAVLPDGTIAVPMRLGRRLVGTVRVRGADLSAEDRSFIEALASGVAEVASRGALRSEVEEAERERAVAAERERIAADLHDSAGQLFVAIKLLSRQQQEHIPDDSPWAQRFSRFAELADRGKWEIDQVIRALAFFPAARRGVAAAIKSLSHNFEMDSGIEVLVQVEGAPVRLTPQVERALYRTAHEALANAWRHARCSTVVVELTFGKEELVLTVTDDGVGLGQALREEGPRVGLANMRKAIEEVGGSFRIRSAKPRGVRVEARVARRGTSSGS
ncbi:MAG TPA: GAF domain-containing protein [Actinomycetota bacterium]|jgi:signal transduction histidine kinase